MKVVVPMIFKLLAIPPAAVLQLARATIKHSLSGHRQVLVLPQVLPGARQDSGAKKIRIVNGGLGIGDVAQARSTRGFLTGQCKNPVANPFDRREQRGERALLVSFQERMGNETCPDDGRFVRRHAPGSRRKVKVIAPGRFCVFSGGVLSKPAQILECLSFQLLIPRLLIEKHVTPRHESSAFRGLERSNANEWTDI